MRFYLIASTGNASRKGKRSVPAELVEAIPLNKKKTVSNTTRKLVTATCLIKLGKHIMVRYI